MSHTPSVKASCFHSARFPSMTGGLSRRGTRISRTVEGWQPEDPKSHMIQLIVASDLRPPRIAALSATDPSPGLRPPSPQGRGQGVRGRQVNKLDQSLNFIATKWTKVFEMVDFTRGLNWLRMSEARSARRPEQGRKNETTGNTG